MTIDEVIRAGNEEVGGRSSGGGASNVGKGTGRTETGVVGGAGGA
jgi:hypothetical protein